VTDKAPSGDDLVGIMAALSNPVRIRVLARLAGGRDYVSRLAREIGISRPLLHMHLQRLEAAGLIAGTLEVSEDGKAMKFYEVTDFDLRLTPEAITEAATTLTVPEPLQPDAKEEP
jgi:DNA-binding transcriptional ArsR family regulator